MVPFAHQLKPIAVLADAIRNNRACLDASECGVGKTFHTLFALKQTGKRAAILCRKSVIPTWREAARSVGVETLFIENVEKLKARQQWIKGSGQNWKWSPEVFGSVTVIDEVHNFSGYASEAGMILATSFNPCIMLSATAADNPTKLRGIGHKLRLTSWDQFYYWCARYGCKKGFRGKGLVFGGTKAQQDEHLDRLHRQIFESGMGVRVTQSECDGFPEHMIETVIVPVEDQGAIDQAYAEELEKLADAAQSQGVELLRARQISEHQKLPAAIELIEDAVESGMSVAVFVNFRDSLERLASHFNCPTIYGEQAASERQEGIEAFQANREKKLVAMIQAGGESISLPDLDGNHPRMQIVFPGWSARELYQAIHRCPRANSKSRVITKLLFADGTVESEKVRPKVARKWGNIQTLNCGTLTDSDLSPL